MLKTDKNINDVIFILDNLRNEDKLELKTLWGEDWKRLALENIKNTNYMVLTGKNKTGKNIPIAVGGFEELYKRQEHIACVWLLSARYIKYNKNLFFKTIGKLLYYASFKYKIMYNYIFKSNFEAKKWLKKFGFRFDNPHPEGIIVPEDFEFFYIVTN